VGGRGQERGDATDDGHWRGSRIQGEVASSESEWGRVGGSREELSIRCRRAREMSGCGRIIRVGQGLIGQQACVVEEGGMGQY
jgi:hypothetical protein